MSTIAARTFLRPSPHYRRALRDSECLSAAKAGDRRAREALLGEYTSMIRHIVRREYRASRWYSREEACQEASVALLRSIDTFDPTLGVPFAAYAAMQVRHALSELRAERFHPGGLAVRVPRKTQRLLATVQDSPSARAAASFTRVDVRSAEDTVLCATADAAALVEASDIRAKLIAALRRLPQRDRDAVLARHPLVGCAPGDGVLARRWGVTAEHVRARRRRALIALSRDRRLDAARDNPD